MSYIPAALLAYLLNSVALTIDKILLTKTVKNPLIYVFYISSISLLATLAFPFAKTPSLLVFTLASLSTIFWTLGAYLMFAALRVGQVSRVIPVIATLTPLFLLLVASFTEAILINEIWAGAFLISGLVFITLTDLKGKLILKELFFELGASVFFAISYLFLREAYLNGNFLTVLVWSRFILIPLGLALLLIPSLRKDIFKKDHKLNLIKGAGLFFILGQTAGGISSLLLNFSISLANPALVNSMQGIQYVFLLIFSLLLVKKFPQIFPKQTFLGLCLKLTAVVLITFGITLLSFSSPDGQKQSNPPEIGVTFSPRYAFSLGLDPKITYQKMLNDLSLDKIRLPVYWDEVENSKGNYDFSNLDYYLDQAFKKDVKIILVLGQKQPRWPECFEPIWAKNLPSEQKKQEVLELLAEEINYFKKFPNIAIWQIENEPLFNYGLCDPNLRDIDFLRREVDLVKSIDPRPILITDSGELSLWRKSMEYSDLFGTSLYRKTWSPYLGYQDYPLPPMFYTLKDKIIRNILGKKEGSTIISELQAEPWLAQGMDITRMPHIQAKQFPSKQISDNFEFAEQTNFSQIYFWGVEWWYFMDEFGYPEYLEVAKELFN